MIDGENMGYFDILDKDLTLKLYFLRFYESATIPLFCERYLKKVLHFHKNEGSINFKY